MEISMKVKKAIDNDSNQWNDGENQFRLLSCTIERSTAEKLYI